jgi:outer membrane receptor protein involved in Fe transport
MKPTAAATGISIALILGLAAAPAMADEPAAQPSGARRPPAQQPAAEQPSGEKPAAGEAGDAGDAEQQPGEPDPATIVITASRKPESAFTIGRSLTVVGRDDIIEAQAQSLPDAVEQVPGVSMQRTNRGAGAPFIRGLVGPQNLILIDGLRFNTATFRTGPSQYLALIDPSSVSRVEVLRGPASVLYGSDAMGGAIQIFPLGWRGDAGTEARAGGRFCSADKSLAVWADAGWQHQRGGLLAGATFRNFEPLRAGGGRSQPLSGYRQAAWRARGRIELTDALELGLTYLGARIADAGRADRLYEGRLRFYDNEDDFLMLDGRWRPGGALRRLRLAAAFHRMDETVDRYRCALGDDIDRHSPDPCLDAAPLAPDQPGVAPLTRNELYRDRVWAFVGLAQADLAFWDERLRLQTGLEGSYDQVASSIEERRAEWQPAWQWREADRGTFSDGSWAYRFGAFVHGEIDLLIWDDQALLATLGGRLAHFGAAADAVPGVGAVDYDHTGLVGSAGLRYLRGDRFMAYADFAQGYRAPNLQETTVLGDTGSKFEVPNADLGPERSHALEVGARLDHDWIRVSAAAFMSWLDDMIDERELPRDEWQQLGIDPVAVGDKPVVQRVNSQAGRIWGAEGRLEIGPWHHTRLWAHLAWVRGEVDTRAGGTVPARRIPPLLGAAGLRHQPPDGRFYLELYTRFAGRQDRLHPSDLKDLRICQHPDHLGDTYGDHDQSCPGTAAWATINLRGGMQVSKNLRLDAALTNLSDTHYRYHGSGVAAPGIGLAVSAVGRY